MGQEARQVYGAKKIQVSPGLFSWKSLCGGKIKIRCVILSSISAISPRPDTLLPLCRLHYLWFILSFNLLLSLGGPVPVLAWSLL